MANAADNAQPQAEMQQESISETGEEAVHQASPRLGWVAQNASAQELVANAAVHVEPTRPSTYAAMLGMQPTQPGRLTDNIQSGTMHSIGGAREAEGAPCNPPAGESDLDNAPCRICRSCDENP